jgi:hypothetical protein
VIICQEPPKVVDVPAVTPDDRFRFMLMIGLLVLICIRIFRRTRLALARG